MTDLAPVQDALNAFSASDPAYSAQLAVYLKGELVVDLTVGEGMQPDSLLPVFSSSKGAAAVVIGLLVERGQLDLDERVATYWPEFAANGKADITVRVLLSHQAGLVGVDGGFTIEEWLGHEELAERLAAQRPYWQPGSAFLYHGLTIGTLADELVRRIEGRTLAAVLHEDVTGPRGIDLLMGSPEEQDHRVVPFLMPDLDVLMASTAEMPYDPDGITTRSMPLGGAMTTMASINEVPFRRAGAPAAGVFTNARGLARLYASVQNDLGAPRLLSDETIAKVSQTQAYGLELDTGLVARFAIIFQVPMAQRWSFGSYRAFGHDGAGGSLAFCDPQYDLAFGYTVQQMPWPGGMDPRGVELTKVLRQCLLS